MSTQKRHDNQRRNDRRLTFLTSVLHPSIRVRSRLVRFIYLLTLFKKNESYIKGRTENGQKPETSTVAEM